MASFKSQMCGGAPEINNNERQEAAKRAKRSKKIAMITTLIVCAIIAFLIILNTVIIPNSKYNDAIALMAEGKYTEALDTFEALDGYKDSTDKISECNTAILDSKYNDAITLLEAGNIIEGYDALVALDGYKNSLDKAASVYGEYIVAKRKVAEVGDYVFFGTYEQDNDTSNGKENIEWLVLDKQDNKALVISKYALDCKPYYTSYIDVTWETCTLRNWLNSDFINTAFSEEENALIPTVTVSADMNPGYSTDPGNETKDRVFLLSISEASKFFISNDARGCKPTEYAVYRGAYTHSDNGNCFWLLRSPGYNQDCNAAVGCGGAVDEYGGPVNGNIAGVRPAMWIDLS